LGFLENVIGNYLPILFQSRIENQLKLPHQMLDHKIQKVMALIMNDGILKKERELNQLAKTTIDRDLMQLVLKAGELLQ
jgi:hypothetical protein